MGELASPALSAWQGFYVIIGSSGAALIGIQFIVITLIANMRLRPTSDSISAFATPTLMHLVNALLISAIMSIPWPSLFPMSIAVALCGVGGLAYCATVIRRARRQTYYRPEWDDWLWYALLPCSIYAVLMITSIFLRTISLVAMFLIGAMALGLLLVGIHNAWDSVTHILFRSDGDSTTSSPGS